MKKLLLSIVVLTLLLVNVSNIFANNEDIPDSKNEASTEIITDSNENNEWFKWYDSLPVEIQKNVDLFEFSDFKIQTRTWFDWFNQLTLEDQSRVKSLDVQQWNEQTSRWLVWFNMLTLDEQREIYLPHIRDWFDRYMSSPLDWQRAIDSQYGFPIIPQKIYGVDTIKGTYIRIDYEWFEWFNSLSAEEQREINFRPEHFAAIERDAYGIGNFDKGTYISIDSSPLLVLYRYSPDLDMSQKYIPKNLNKIYRIDLCIDNKSVYYSSNMFLLTFDISNSNISIDDINHLYGVLYNDDGTKEYNNGTYNKDTKVFSFYVNKSGNYAVTIVKNTI